MKTGFLFFQSIASSALRSGGRPSSYTVGRQIISERRGNNINGATYLIATAAGIGGVLCASSSSGTCSSYKSTAMCSSKDNDSTSPNGNRKSIDEPDNTPQHNPQLPFSESSLRHDTYNGITIDLTTILSQETESKINTEFEDMLGKALGIWKEEKRKGIWLKIPTSHSHLISPATKHGFDFQHAEPGFCVLTKWLPQGSVSRLPNGPTHQVIKCFNMMKAKKVHRCAYTLSTSVCSFLYILTYSQVGIGALVIHPTTGKMLAVQERTGPAAKRKVRVVVLFLPY